MADADEPEWEQGLEALRTYVSVRGPSPVISSNARVKGFALGPWAAARREEFWGGTLDPGRVEMLSRIPGWSWRGTHHRRWQTRYETLARHARRGGSAQIPDDAVVNHLQLGAWASQQRHAYARGTLSAEIVALLEALPGWQWR